MINLPRIDSINVSGKKAFVRCDFDVPIENGKIKDDSRLISSISTIEYLLECGASVIAAGHMGRPDGKEDLLSLEIVAKWFADEFPGSTFEKINISGLDGWKIKDNFIVLENLRYFKEEEENDSDFSQKLASLADIYVNEAFASSHREHASIVGVPKLLRHYAGFHISKEVRVLGLVLENPKRPLTVIVAGAKIETKLPLVSRMHVLADYVLVGGEIADQTKILIKEQHEEIVGHKAMLLVAELNHEKTDTSAMSIENFSQIIARSGCVVWNGPMGYLEKGYEDSTLNIAKSIINSNAYKVVGGGDTIGLLSKHELIDKFDFVSMGGGAMLEFLSGKELPGIKVLISS
jgi:phosphoglycerate kinase